MTVLLISMLLGIFIFLFSMHVIAREDIVFLRKNISLTQLFDIAIFLFLFGLLSARIFYILFTLDTSYLSPFVFFLFIYFPGLSLLGGILGAMLFLFFYARRKKLPWKRVADVISISLLIALSVSTFFYALFQTGNYLFVYIISSVLYGIFYLFFLKVLYPVYIRGDIAEGSMVSIFLLIFSLMTFFINLIISAKLTLISIEGITIILLLFVSLLFLFKENGFFTIRIKK